MLSRLARRATALAVVAVTIGAACREPTEITLELTTDLPCDQLRTSIYVGRPADLARPLSELGVAAEATTCDPTTKRIGTIAVIPSGSNADTVAIKVVARTKGSSCDTNPSSGCVEARRTIGFLPHTPLRLPIALNADCKDLVCANASETCVRGRCVPAIIDPSTCIGSGCPEPTGDGGLPITDAAVDATSTCAPLLPAITYVWHFDDPTDNATQEASKAFPVTTLGTGEGLGVGAPACGKGLARSAAAAPTKLATGKLLSSDKFRVAFRFQTQSPAFIVSYVTANMTGWRLGVSQATGMADVCTGACTSSNFGASLADGTWHTLEMNAAQGTTNVLLDGLQAISIAANPKFTSDATLTVTGAGTLDELTFSAN